MNILVVDDEPEYRLLMRNYLMQEGWDVFMAEDGEEGMQKLAEAKMDLIISDVYMPVMDGLKFHRKVRQHPGYGQTPFLFVSAYDDQLTLDAVQDPKIEGFMRKGKSVGELKEWILYLTAPEGKRPKLPPGEKRVL